MMRTALRVSLRHQALAFALLLSVLIAAPCATAQERAEAPRADGLRTPLMVYRAARPAGECAPLAIISHGAGGSERGYRYLAQSLSEAGYTTVVMGHRESGMKALRGDIRQRGFRTGIEALVKDPEAEQDRLVDVTATLRWADAQCHAPYRVLMGHSMGAITTMLEAGAKNIIGVSTPPAAADRFDAYVALSPEGPGVVFGEHGWRDIHKPMLILTGTRDQSLKGGPQARQIPWHDLPGTGAQQCQWMGVIDGATHMNFGGNGMGAEHVVNLVTPTIKTFLTGARQGRCPLPPQVRDMHLQAK